MVQFVELWPMFPDDDEVSPDTFALFTSWSFIHILTGIILAVLTLWLFSNRIVIGGTLSLLSMVVWELLEYWWEQDDILMADLSGSECLENRFFDVFVGFFSYSVIVFLYLLKQ